MTAADVRDQVAAAIDQCRTLTPDALADAVLQVPALAEAEQTRARLAEYENAVNWHTTCTSCARILDSCYAETVRAEKAEAAVDRVRHALDEMCREPHPNHDHLCPEDVRRDVLKVIDEPTEKGEMTDESR